MSNLEEFHNQVGNIETQYWDDTITYNEAKQRLKISSRDLRMEYSKDVPVDIMQETFHAFAELQIYAYRKEDITEATVLASLDEEAHRFFDSMSSPEDIAQLIALYKRKLGTEATFEDISLECGAPSMN